MRIVSGTLKSTLKATVSISLMLVAPFPLYAQSNGRTLRGMASNSPTFQPVEVDLKAPEGQTSPSGMTEVKSRSIVLEMDSEGEIDSEKIAEAIASVTDSSSEIENVTEVQALESEAVAPGTNGLVSRIATNIRAKSHHQIKMSAKKFPEWFTKNKVRISIVAFEMTLMTALKVTELMVSPAPIALMTAMTAALMLSSVLGVVEWNFSMVADFITKRGSFVQGVMNRIAGGPENSEKNPRLRKYMKDAWEFAKTAEINFAIFGIFKIFLFATTQVDGGFLDGLLAAFKSVGGADVVKWAELGVVATGISFPTNKVIYNLREKGTEAADGDPVKLLKNNNKMMFLNSTALTTRAILFSSAIVAGTLHWPLLTVAAYSGLFTLCAGSFAKLWYDSHRKRPPSCSGAL